MIVLIDGLERPAPPLPEDATAFDLSCSLALTLRSEGRWLADVRQTPADAELASQVAVFRGTTTSLAATAAVVKAPLAGLLELLGPLHDDAALELRATVPGDGRAFRELVETWQTVLDSLEAMAGLGEPHPPAEPAEAAIAELADAAQAGDRERAAVAVERLGRIAAGLSEAFPAAAD